MEIHVYAEEALVSPEPFLAGGVKAQEKGRCKEGWEKSHCNSRLIV